MSLHKTGMYVQIINGVPMGTIARPQWFFDGAIPLSDADLAERGVLPLYHDKPDVDPSTHWFVEIGRAGWVVEADKVRSPFRTYAIIQPPERDLSNDHEPLPAEQWVFDDEAGTVMRHRAVPLTAKQSRDRALDFLAADRWAYEVQGIVYTRPSDGKTYGIATDRESQSKLGSERAAGLTARRAPGEVWKCLDLTVGTPVWVPFTDTEIIQVAELARAHVASAYRREGELAALIVAGDLTVTWSPPAA